MRNIHDLEKDFIQEFWGLYINDIFYTMVKNITLESKDPWSNFTEIGMYLRESVKFLDPDIRAYFNRVWIDMHNWAKMIDELGMM